VTDLFSPFFCFFCFLSGSHPRTSPCPVCGEGAGYGPGSDATDDGSRSYFSLLATRIGSGDANTRQE